MILVDLDNVLADFERIYRALINSLTNRSAEREDIHDYSFAKALGLSAEEDMLVWSSFNDDAGWLKLPLMPGAAEYMHGLRTLDRVAIVTNRPEAARGVTEQWLARNAVEFDELHVTENPSKLEYVRTAGWLPRAVTEDAWHHATAFAAAGVPVVLVDYPWNRKGSDANIHRVKDLGEALATMRRLLGARGRQDS